MKIACVTSMSKEYYDTIGKIMVNSYTQVWPNSIELYVYTEDTLELDGVNVIDIHKACDPNLKSYLDFIGNHFSRGFSYKVFSWIHAVRNIEADWILWIDADVACIKAPDDNFMSKMFPNNSQCAYMGTTMYKDKKGWKDKKNCDSAILSFNTKTDDSDKFVDLFEELYISRKIKDKTLFPKPNDTHAFIHSIENCATPSINLNPKKEALSPLKETFLNDYFRHFKAGRKDKTLIYGLVDKLIKTTEKLSGDKLAQRIDRVERRFRNR